MTDNRTNEPTEAMILAGLNAYSSKGLELDGYETTEEYPSLEMWGGRFASQMRAALVAAQGAAPQAEPDERIQAWERLIQHPVWRSCFEEERPLIDSVMERIDNLADLEMTVNELTPAPVLPSSTVDEDALAEVLSQHVLGAPNGGTASWAWLNCSCAHRIEIAGVTREHVVALGRKHQARAVGEWFKEQGR